MHVKVYKIILKTRKQRRNELLLTSSSLFCHPSANQPEILRMEFLSRLLLPFSEIYYSIVLLTADDEDAGWWLEMQIARWLFKFIPETAFEWLKMKISRGICWRGKYFFQKKCCINYRWDVGQHIRCQFASLLSFSPGKLPPPSTHAWWNSAIQFSRKQQMIIK